MQKELIEITTVKTDPASHVI